MIIKELTQINGISGSEDNVRKYIIEKIKDFADEISVDSIGNIIALKRGKSNDLRVMLSAHMDEVGLMVTGYSDGMIKFKPVGGIDERILPGKRVVIGDNSVPGIIGIKPIHLQERDDRGNNIKLKSMYIDIGAENKEEAQAKAPLGEYIAFMSEFTELGNDCIKAKALDDRVGCAILIECLKDRYEFDLYACFTVQEEVGLRGARVAAYSVKPDLAFVLEGTTCSDVEGVEEHSYSTLLGGGAALTIMDRTSYGNKELVAFLLEVAKENAIKAQLKKTTTGGNDAGKIQMSGTGVKIAAISVPCRYIHSPVSVMNKSDFKACQDLIKKALQELNDQKCLNRLVNGGNLNV